MGLYIGKMDRKWLSRVFIIMLADILGILGSYLLALWARFDFHFMDIPPEFLQGYLSTIWWWVLICLAVFWLCNLYNSIWQFGQRGRADADHPGLCHPGRAELCMHGAVWGAYAPVLLCVGPAVQLLYHRRYPVFLSGRAVSAQPGAQQPEGHRKRDDHRRGPGRAAAAPGIRRQQSSQQPGGLSHRRQPRQARPHSGGRAHCGRPPGHSPGRETVRHPQDHLRHPRPCRESGGRKF